MKETALNFTRTTHSLGLLEEHISRGCRLDKEDVGSQPEEALDR
jgi:hypothetical protein